MKKVYLTLATLTPIIGTAVYVIFYISFMMSMMVGSQADDLAILSKMSSLMNASMIFSLFFMIVNIALMTYYIYLARCNDELSPSGKNLWTVLLFVFGSITMIVYLFMYVYFKPEDKLRIQLNITRSNKKTWTGVILALPFGMLILFFYKYDGLYGFYV